MYKSFLSFFASFMVIFSIGLFWICYDKPMQEKPRIIVAAYYWLESSISDEGIEAGQIMSGVCSECAVRETEGIEKGKACVETAKEEGCGEKEVLPSQ